MCFIRIRITLHFRVLSSRQYSDFHDWFYFRSYFGRDKLARDITLNDMSQEDIDLLPLYHIQDGTDRNGRVLVHILNHVLSNKIKAETLGRHSTFIYILSRDFASLTPRKKIRLNYFVFFNLLSHLEAARVSS